MDETAGQGDENRLYGLVEIADRQQAAVQAALEGLAAERAVLARERGTFARQVQGLQAKVQGAARAAVAGVAAVQAATGPLLSRLGSVAAQAGQADAPLRRMVAWASWWLLSWIMAALAALVLLGWLASTLGRVLNWWISL